MHVLPCEYKQDIILIFARPCLDAHRYPTLWVYRYFGKAHYPECAESCMVANGYCYPGIHANPQCLAGLPSYVEGKATTFFD